MHQQKNIYSLRYLERKTQNLELEPLIDDRQNRQAKCIFRGIMQDASALGFSVNWWSLIHYTCSVNSCRGFFLPLVVQIFSFFNQSVRKLTGFNHNKNLYDDMEFGIWKCKDCLCLLTFFNFYELVKIKNSVKMRKYRNCCY